MQNISWARRMFNQSIILFIFPSLTHQSVEIVNKNFRWTFFPSQQKNYYFRPFTLINSSANFLYRDYFFKLHKQSQIRFTLSSTLILFFTLNSPRISERTIRSRRNFKYMWENLLQQQTDGSGYNNFRKPIEGKKRARCECSKCVGSLSASFYFVIS